MQKLLRSPLLPFPLMEQKKPIFFIFCLSICFVTLQTGIQAVNVSSRNHHHHHVRPMKLFAFGDSYADTGNIKVALANSWKEPYGITFPGKPAGRFSDGRVLTDYVASFLGIKTPVAYRRWRKFAVKSQRYGINFAYGGTGVFNTLNQLPNMTTQIDFLQHLILDRIYTKCDVNSSVALVSVVGNDYGTYIAKTGTKQSLPGFVTSVVDQIYVNLKRIHGLGVRKIAITGLEPLGCLPQSTASSSYQKCNGSENEAVNLHNHLLQRAVHKLNNETKNSTFVILDLYGAFMNCFKKQGEHSGSLKFQNPLKPCCMGISKEYSCGSVDKNGARKYEICEKPESAFFWDALHPSQEGWHAVYSALQPSLNQLYY